MSPPLIGVVEEEGPSNARDSICQSSSAFKERNYMGLSECSSVDSSTISTASEDNSGSLNLKATELRLGLPGSQSPERDPKICVINSANLDEKPLFPLHPLKDDSYLLKTVTSGNKRGFSDAMDGFSEGNFFANSEANIMLSPRPSPSSGVKSGTVKDNSVTQPAKTKERVSHNVGQEKPHAANKSSPNCLGAVNNSAPATKAQVVGWPPIRSFRKNTLATTSKNTEEVVGWPPIRSFKNNTLATTSKNTEEVDGKAGAGALFVKVSMDGAPYLRKVDLRTYCTYQELSSALEKMFSCFTIGQYGSHGVPGKEVLSESKLKDLLHGSENVVTYEDKDGDWMLVGDVPWEMFIDTCKRLRIMKSSDAIGLAPWAVEKSRNKN